MLPYFGGSSSVWATSLLFFTTMLFVGYLYVYLLGRYSDAKQSRIHLYVVGVGGAAVLVSPLIWRSFYPPLYWTLGNALHPSLEVLLALMMSIGIPYFLLSTTGPLLQYWYGITERREPYKLYALSNIGSFLALGTYPFLVEPNLALRNQEAVWTVLFILYVALVALVCNRFFRSQQDIPAYKSDLSTDKSDLYVEVGTVSRGRKVAWVALAALPSFLLVATTTQITQVIAPIPFLWVLPLSLYLLSFIFAFWGFGRGMVTWIGLVVFAAFAYAALDASHSFAIWRLIADLGLLFFCGLFCHGAIYSLRPTVRHVPFFYLAISFGGMVGALLASMVAPLVFNDLLEFPLGILLSAIAAFVLIPARPVRGFATTNSLTNTEASNGARVGPLFEFGSRSRMAVRLLLLVLIIRAGFTYFNSEESYYSVLSSTRNFYGTAIVEEADGQRILMNGGTLHGIQSLDPELEFVPSTYYSPESGVARAIMHAYLNNLDRTLKVGVIGLGVGTLNAYCGSGDEYIFFEIDPRVVSLAKEYFTYASHCAGFEVRLGDARIVLENEKREGTLNGFDVLVVDAFNDDTIPIHLITKEAIQLYLDHTRGPKSILAIHTSNRYLDLPPAVISVAESLGLTAVVVNSSGDENELASSSEWVLISTDPDFMNADSFASAEPYVPDERIPVWTDDYADVLSVVWIPDEAFEWSTLVGLFDGLRYRIAAWIEPDAEEEVDEYVGEPVEEVVEE